MNKKLKRKGRKMKRTTIVLQVVTDPKGINGTTTENPKRIAQAIMNDIVMSHREVTDSRGKKHNFKITEMALISASN